MSSHMRIVQPAIAKTLKHKQQNIRKITVGEIDISQPFQDGKVLMLVGATGAGKSTLINGFVNYVRGVKYDDCYRYRLIGSETIQTQAESQTKWITAYTFPKKAGSSRLPYTFTIIDTPGYGDTQGIHRDKEITKQIKEFFSIKEPQSIDHIDGIGFVVQASLARLTHTQKYIFDSILSIFGKDIAKNIFVMITFADGKKPPVLAAIKQAGFEYRKVFKFNNSALFPDEEDDAEAGETDKDKDDAFNKMFWEMGEKSFENFLDAFGQTESISLQLTKEVLQERERLECLVQGLQQQIQAGLFKVDQLHQEELVLNRYEKEIETNKDFVYEIEETRQRKIDLETGSYVTNCLKCNITCHFPCRLPNNEDKMNCAAMVGHKNCGVCPMKCNWQQHVNNEYRFELYTVKVKKTSQELKQRYEAAQGKKTEKERLMTGLSKELETMYCGVYYNIYNVKTILERLDEIALRPNPLTEVQYIDILIQSEQMEAKEGWTRRIQAYSEVRKEAEVISNIKDKTSILQKCKGAAAKSWEYLRKSFSYSC